MDFFDENTMEAFSKDISLVEMILSGGVGVGRECTHRHFFGKHVRPENCRRLYLFQSGLSNQRKKKKKKKK